MLFITSLVQYGALCVAMILFCFGLFELHALIRRFRSRKEFRDRRSALFDINPRSGRTTIYMTISGSARRLRQSIFTANNPIIESRLKEIAEAQSIGNDCEYVNTYEMSEIIVAKPWQVNLYSHVAKKIGTMSKDVQAILFEMSRRTAVIAKRITKRLCKVFAIFICAVITFVHNSGGRDNNVEDDSYRTRN